MHSVSPDLARKFCSRTRRYAAFYRIAGEREVVHEEIEKFVKEAKVHRSALDQDYGYLTQILDENDSESA